MRFTQGTLNAIPRLKAVDVHLYARLPEADVGSAKKQQYGSECREEIDWVKEASRVKFSGVHFPD